MLCNDTLKIRTMEEDKYIFIQELDKYKKIKESLKKYFSIDKLWPLIKRTLKKWENEKGSTYVLYENIKENNNIIGIIISIASSDWAGMSEACVGVIHTRGYNIWQLVGLVAEATKNEKKENVGMILMYIKPINEDILKNLLSEIDRIARILKYTSYGKSGSSLLAVSESNKFQIMALVVKYVNKKLKDNEELKKEIISPEGEIAKFFSSRSTEYLTDRTIKQLGDQIINNMILLKKVRKTKFGDIEITNMTTNKEELTCITIAAKQRIISLDELLNRIEYALPKFQRKTDKIFITSDDIKIIRVEINNPNNEFYISDSLERLKKFLTKYLKRSIISGNVVSKGIITAGQEYYSRAIIPLLVSEFKRSMITQIYIKESYKNEFFTEIKLIIVTSIEKGRKELELKLLEGIESVGGLFVINCLPSRTYGQSCVFMFDIQGDLDILRLTSDAHKKLREYLKLIFEEVRDFDEGMRKATANQFSIVKKSLSNYHEEEVSEIYYLLDGFHRFQSSVEEIVIEILCGLEALNKAKKNLNKISIVIKEIPGLKKSKSTVISFVSKNRRKVITFMKNLMERFEVSICKINKNPYILIIANATIQRRALNKEEIESILMYFSNKIEK